MGKDRDRITEPECYAILSRHGIQVPEVGIAHSADDAVREADRIGYPVVMKIISPDITHKSDSGGVVTGIADPNIVRLSWTRIMDAVGRSRPEARTEGILVMPCHPAGLELIVGGTTDPTFGKVMLIGVGGLFVELVRDSGIILLPADRAVFQAAVRRLQAYPLIRGYRGASACDEEALLDLLVHLSAFFVDQPDIAGFDINPVILYRDGYRIADARMEPVKSSETQEEKGHGPSAAPAALFSPDSIAVVGASSDPKKVGYAVFRNLLAFPGHLYPVNPNRSEILGRPAYPSVTAIPGTIDAAVIAVPAPQVPRVMEEIGGKGIPLAIIVSAGFREAGPEGESLEYRVRDIGRRFRIRIVGPNCLGVIFPHRHLNTTFDPVSPRPGHIGFISQSGAVVTTIVDWSIPESIGFSAVISIGNQVDLGFEEFLRIVGEDPETRAIILYIEELRDGRRFLDEVSAICRDIPVVAVKSGSSRKGTLAASTHTGSLAGNYAVYQAAFHQFGMISADSLREAFQAAELLASEGPVAGPRAVVITTAGGFAVLASDYAERFGIELPDLPQEIVTRLDMFLPPSWNHSNPLDIIGDGGAERYARVFDLFIQFQEFWDIAFVIAVPSAVLDAGQIAQEIVRFSRHTHKMIVSCLLGGDTMKSGVRILRDAGIPNYPDLEDAFRVIGNILHG